jgi:hypothetical protein
MCMPSWQREFARPLFVRAHSFARRVLQEPRRALAHSPRALAYPPELFLVKHAGDSVIVRAESSEDTVVMTRLGLAILVCSISHLKGCTRCK